MSIRDFLEEAKLRNAEKEVIKKGYGLEKFGKQTGAASLAASLKLSIKDIPSTEASALVKLKTKSGILEWLIAKEETDKVSDGEGRLLKALTDVDTKDPKPYIFTEIVNDERAGGEDPGTDNGAESAGPTVETIVDTSISDSKDGGGEDVLSTNPLGVSGADAKSTEEDGPACVSTRNLEEFKSNLQRLNSMEGITKTTVIRNDGGHSIFTVVQFKRPTKNNPKRPVWVGQNRYLNQLVAAVNADLEDNGRGEISFTSLFDRPNNSVIHSVVIQ